MKTTSAFSLFFALLLTACQQAVPAEENHLGELHFPVTGAPAALPHFEEGLMLLHSFEYEDAREAFQEAQAKDSSCVMAYWGEAMTYNHPIWKRQLLTEGQEALAKLDSTAALRIAKATLPIEKQLMEAVEILFGEGEREERATAYAEFMTDLYKKQPNNQEIAAFYALSLLGSVPFGREEKIYDRAARIAQGILEENPKHPGALHYLIHSYDDPEHAQMALPAANAYAQVAPDAGHALHMPSHIFVAMGMWDEVVRSNIASWEAGVKRKDRKGLDNKGYNYHALHWLMYGLLQQGKKAEARQLLQNMIGYTNEQFDKNARAYLIAMQANYLAETNDWQDSLSQIDVLLNQLIISQRSRYYFTQGMRAYHLEDASTLDSILQIIKKEHLRDGIRVGSQGVPMCGLASPTRLPNPMEMDAAQTMIYELQAMQSWLKRDSSQTEAFLQKACALEDQISYSFGPPMIPKPSHELYGEWLIEVERPAAAIEHFEKALERGPGRVAAIKAKEKAKAMLESS